MLEAFAAGDLTHRIERDYHGLLGQVSGNANQTAENLARVLGEVRAASDALTGAAGQVSATAQSLSQAASEQAASLEQSESVGQIQGAMGQLAKATQQNASASEELAATAEELSGQAGQLQDSVSFFKVGDEAVGALPVRRAQVEIGHTERRLQAPAAAMPRTPASGRANFKPF